MGKNGESKEEQELRESVEETVIEGDIDWEEDDE
jgi:hypothetical protein